MSSYKITFGTSGWREKMDSGFNEENVLRAAYGVGKYLKMNHRSGTVVIGYDTRKNSAEFAELACGVMGSFGFEVLMTDAPTPTPALVYSLLNRKAIGGIQMTASHNPPEYNGMKLYLDSGAAPLKNITDWIARLIPGGSVKKTPCKSAKISAKATYLAGIKKRFDLSKVRGMVVVVDTRHGAGGSYLSDLLTSCGATVYELNKDYDSEFGGVSPNPTEPNVKALIDMVIEKKAAIGIANDGDADRFAVVDNTGKYFGANENGLMLCEYLFKYRNGRGKVAKSIQSTAAFDRLCQKYNVPCVEVAVGFKYIAKELFEGAVFGVEGAALGVAFVGWIPDKDGIAAGAAMCEMISQEGVPLSQIWQRVSQEYGYGQFVTFEFPKMDKIAATLDFLIDEPERELFGGRKIVGRSFLDGVKLTLEDGAWVLIRASGTEASVRVYVEAKTKKETDELSDATRRLFGF